MGKKRAVAKRDARHTGQHPVVQQFGNKVVSSVPYGLFAYDLVVRQHAVVAPNEPPLQLKR